MIMDEKQKQVGVLLVPDEDDGGKLKAVEKSCAKDGLLRMLLPSMENLEDFIKVEKNRENAISLKYYNL